MNKNLGVSGDFSKVRGKRELGYKGNELWSPGCHKTLEVLKLVWNKKKSVDD